MKHLVVDVKDWQDLRAAQKVLEDTIRGKENLSGSLIDLLKINGDYLTDAILRIEEKCHYVEKEEGLFLRGFLACDKEPLLENDGSIPYWVMQQKWYKNMESGALCYWYDGGKKHYGRKTTETSPGVLGAVDGQQDTSYDETGQRNVLNATEEDIYDGRVIENEHEEAS